MVYFSHYLVSQIVYHQILLMVTIIMVTFFPTVNIPNIIPIYHGNLHQNHHGAAINHGTVVPQALGPPFPRATSAPWCCCRAIRTGAGWPEYLGGEMMGPRVS